MAKHTAAGTTPTRTFRLRPQTVKKVERIYEVSDFYTYDEFIDNMCDHYVATHPALKAKMGPADNGP
jgi:hypothetical protein